MTGGRGQDKPVPDRVLKPQSLPETKADTDRVEQAALVGRRRTTTDRHRPLSEAVEGDFGAAIDLAMPEEVGATEEDAEKRYGPPISVGARRRKVAEERDRVPIGRAIAERNRAFRKILENHARASPVHIMPGNLVRTHRALLVTHRHGGQGYFEILLTRRYCS
jgi:hypothetical protein